MHVFYFVAADLDQSECLLVLEIVLPNLSDIKLISQPISLADKTSTVQQLESQLRIFRTLQFKEASEQPIGLA